MVIGMIIKRRIKLGQRIFYISIDCEYKMKDGMVNLCLKNYVRDYYDDGDLSILIKKLEKNYRPELCKKYNDYCWFLTDCLYIYENIPFISGIGDYYLDKDGFIYSESYITKEEIDTNKKEKNIKLKDHSKFVLADERTWLIGDEDE